MNIVGTAAKIVTPWSTTSCSAASASNRGIRAIEAPRRNAVFMTAVWPKVWNRGRPPKTTSSRRMSTESISDVCTCSTIEKCELTAPFGVPVVPLV
jgi:hypothetical protein